MRPAVLITSALALLPGCYVSHVLEEDGGRARTDSAIPWLDAWVPPDAFMPIEPGPDVGPDERPTGPWEDVAPPPPDMPALVLVGDPVRIDVGGEGAGEPTLAWSGRGWGLMSGEHFRTLGEDGTPASEIVRTAYRSAQRSLEFALGRYAVVIGSQPPYGDFSALGGFDRGGAFQVGWEDGIPGQFVDIAYLESARQWIVAASTFEMSGVPAEISVYAASSALMRRVGEPIVLATDAAGRVGLVGARSRVVAVWTVGDDVMAQALRGPTLALDGIPFRVMSLPRGPSWNVEVELFRDRVAVAATDGRDIHVALIDPWDHVVTTGPREIGPAGGTSRPGLAVAPEHGFIVACWERGIPTVDGDDSLALQVIGADGAPWGQRLDIGVPRGRVGGVDCGWNGREVVVVSWQRLSMFSQRVRPTFL